MLLHNMSSYYFIRNLFLPGKGANFNETQASETECTEACWSNYPLSAANGGYSETKWIDLAIIRKEYFK